MIFVSTYFAVQNYKKKMIYAREDVIFTFFFELCAIYLHICNIFCNFVPDFENIVKQK